LALIAGDDLGRWHNQPIWQAKSAAARARPVTVFNARQRTAARMAMTAFATVAGANGQQVLRTVKNKEMRFSRDELEKYILALIEVQEGLCAITQLTLQLAANMMMPSRVHWIA
jgi:hypothetical protein